MIGGPRVAFLWAGVALTVGAVALAAAAAMMNADPAMSRGGLDPFGASCASPGLLASGVAALALGMLLRMGAPVGARAAPWRRRRNAFTCGARSRFARSSGLGGLTS